MTIKVYSTPACPSCSMLKNFLKNKNISFEEINLTNHRELIPMIVEKTGKAEIPVIQINEEFISGFNKEELMKKIQNGL